MSHREPIFNVPGVIVGLLAVFRRRPRACDGCLPETEDTWLTAVLAFVPARLGGLAADLPGGRPAAVTAFVTHQFVHGDLAHLLINSAWLLAFGTPVARRTGPVRFLAFFLLCGVAGALLYLAVNGPMPDPGGRGLGRDLGAHGRGIPLPVPQHGQRRTDGACRFPLHSADDVA